MNNWVHFKSSFIVTIVGLALALFVGGTEGLIIAGILGILEVSLSFDNAIVNAKVLVGMSDTWRHRFITWGMVIAVFGMRLVFPLLIVSVVTDISMYQSLHLALFEPAQYKHALESAHVVVMGFGGSFLMMVFLTYFIDETKDVHWLRAIEAPLIHLGQIKAVQAILVLLFSYIIYTVLKTLPTDHSEEFIVASVLGVITYVSTDVIKVLIEKINGVSEDDEVSTGKGALMVAKSGLASFIYLEILDASFSFDGVLGAFALTQDFLIIAIGLGIGAMFVRSLTLMLVASGHLAEYKYLEHGAFWAIGTLATIMYINTFMQISEVFTGLIGAALIIAAFTHSYFENKAEEREAKAAAHGSL